MTGPYLPRIWSKSARGKTLERSEKTSCCNARTRVQGILPMPLLCALWLHSVGFPMCVIISWSLYLSIVHVCVSQPVWQQHTGMPTGNADLLCFFNPFTGVGILLPAGSSRFAGKV